MSKQSIQIPTIVIFEVYRKLKQTIAEEVALEAVFSLSQYDVLELDREVALLAADLSLQFELAMADR